MRRQLELLAPARDYQIGIAAIDCGADAVYIAGPQFGARQAAGNEIDDIRRLCEYAHRFGVRIFVTLNTILYDDELEAAYMQMLAVQEAGADAIIVQDLAILAMADKGIGDIRNYLLGVGLIDLFRKELCKFPCGQFKIIGRKSPHIHRHWDTLGK